MSHWTEIKTQIRDLDAVRATVAELGKRLEIAPAGQKVVARGYYRNTMECDAVIHLAGPYDVGLNRNADGSYTIVTDYWDGHVAKELGENCNRLIQLYGVHRATLTAKKQGFQVQRLAGKNGAINLRITGGRL